MNIQEMNIIKQLSLENFASQRKLADVCQCSLGMVNSSLKTLESLGYLTAEKSLSDAATSLLEENHPRQAVILAAGNGMRMVPINTEHPKAFLTVNGEILIERLIRQLHAAGVYKIYIVVGFLKERFEYLIDDFGVELIVNRDYTSYNNLHSLFLAKDKLCNSYILPCDIWCKENPFSSAELYSWYMVKDIESRDSEIRVNRKQELVRIKKGEQGNPMVGICYITAQDAALLEKNIEKLYRISQYDQAFWEEGLYQDEKMLTWAKVIPADQVIEINTYEQLKELDEDIEHLKNKAIEEICGILDVVPSDIKNITATKKGMTNRSFRFNCKDREYIMRIPREDTNRMVNRFEEACVYENLREETYTEDVLYINPETGLKLARFIENSRYCDPTNENDVRKCMSLLRHFHGRKRKVDHSFDIFGKIDSYESLWNGRPSVYRDYKTIKKEVFSLRPFIEENIQERVLTHMDVSPDNFLIDETGEKEKLRLIDWEYAGMQDPHVDIAMFALAAGYDKEHVDHLIDLYFKDGCSEKIRIKIYCYISACGLMWSNWCEYKQNGGDEFGEYSLQQYRYAKEYYRYAMAAMKS